MTSESTSKSGSGARRDKPSARSTARRQNDGGRSRGASVGGASSSSAAGGGGFSKIHLSALFQRRQQGRNDINDRSSNSSSGGGGGGGSSSSISSDLNHVTSGHAATTTTTMEDELKSNATEDNHTYTDDRSATKAGNMYKTWSHPPARSHMTSSASLPPTSNSSAWNRRGSNASVSSLSRVRRMSSGIVSLFSPRGFDENREPKLDPLLVEVFENPADVAAFDEALQDDAGQQDSHVVTSSVWPSAGALGQLGVGGNGAKKAQAERNSRSRDNEEGEEVSLDDGVAEKPTITKVSHPRKVGRIAAASDFAPVFERTHRQRSNKVDAAAAREGILYNIVRFPLLLSIFLVIATEFAAYVLIRQLVNLIEFMIAWRGYKGTLRAKLRKATTSEQWRDVALELDSYLGYEQWKCEDASGLYDWILVKKVIRNLHEMREQDDAEGILNVLELCLRNNFAGIENFRLYSETFFGTKYLIENYLSEVEEAMEYIASTDKITPEVKRQFYRTTQRNMGRSALCLSGGGSFGYYHVGVVRALLDANLLPPIITGTSAGGLIAALACTRTNEELKRVLVPELADRITACEESINVWAVRFWRTGARFDILKWAEKAQFFTRGSMTFAEAYARTGKVLNISVIPSDRHSPVKLLNHITAPNCIIWSSLLASAAVPGLLNPVCLMQKTRSGHAVPWNWGHRFKDGSLRVDIPLQDLHTLFNVTYPIVSQVNPHVHLFFFAPKGMPGRPVAHRKGKGWRGGFLLSASEHVLKLNLSMNFKIIRDLDLLPSLLGQDWSSVFLQRFSGAVTIWPKTRAWDWVRILSDPDRKELTRMLNVGQSVTFPKLHMVENRARLERLIEVGRKVNRRSMKAAAAAAAGIATPASAPGTSLDGHSANDEHGGASSHPLRTGYVEPLSTADARERGGFLTQSDTDGTGEENDRSSKVDGGRHEGEHVDGRRAAHRRMFGRSKATIGFSALNGRGAGGEGSQSRDATMTPNNLDDDEGAAAGGVETPNELPRDMRSRSIGLDDDDAEEAFAAAARVSAKKANELDRLRRRTKAGGGGGGENVPFPSLQRRRGGDKRNDGFYTPIDEQTDADDVTVRKHDYGVEGSTNNNKHHHHHHNNNNRHSRRVNERGHVERGSDESSSSSSEGERG